MRPKMRWPAALGSGAALFAATLCVLGAPAHALPITVTTVTYDDARRRLTLDVTGQAEIRARQVDRRILLEIPDSRLRGRTFSPPVDSRRVRAILVSEVAGRPPFVRIELALAPGIEPILSIQQSGGRIYVTLADPPPAEGERDLEHLPQAPGPDLPPLADRGGRARPQPRPVDVPAGLPRVAPSLRPIAVATPPPAPTIPGTPLEVRAAPPRMTVPERGPGTRSFGLLSLHQVEAAENVPGKRLQGFPTGPASLEVQHWIWNVVGVGFEARYLAWTGKGDLSLDRQDALVVVRAGGRLPLPLFEPELYLAGAQRYEVASTHTGLDSPAFALGGGFRFQPAEAIGLRLWGQLFPFGIGADQVWRAGATFLVDAGPALFSLGYNHDDITVVGGKKTYGAAVVGAGIQW